MEQLETIRIAIDEITGTCGRIGADMTECSRIAGVADVDVTAAERAVNDAERLLRDAERLLRTDGQNALQQAAEKQRELGHQSDRMTEMSRDARRLADTYVT